MTAALFILLLLIGLPISITLMLNGGQCHCADTRDMSQIRNQWIEPNAAISSLPRDFWS